MQIAFLARCQLLQFIHASTGLVGEALASHHCVCASAFHRRAFKIAAEITKFYPGTLYLLQLLLLAVIEARAILCIELIQLLVSCLIRLPCAGVDCNLRGRTAAVLGMSTVVADQGEQCQRAFEGYVHGSLL